MNVNTSQNAVVAGACSTGLLLGAIWAYAMLAASNRKNELRAILQQEEQRESRSITPSLSRVQIKVSGYSSRMQETVEFKSKLRHEEQWPWSDSQSSESSEIGECFCRSGMTVKRFTKV
jgi:hypothetical protein